MDVAASAPSSSSDEVYRLNNKLHLLKLKEENNENEGDDFKEALTSFTSEYHVASILDPFGRHDLELYDPN